MMFFLDFLAQNDCIITITNEENRQNVLYPILVLPDN